MLEQSSEEEVTPIAAFEMIINLSLKPFHAKMNLRLQKFRDEELWNTPVQIVLSNNEIGLKALFEKYDMR